MLAGTRQEMNRSEIGPCRGVVARIQPIIATTADKPHMTRPAHALREARKTVLKSEISGVFKFGNLKQRANSFLV